MRQRSNPIVGGLVSGLIPRCSSLCCRSSSKRHCLDKSYLCLVGGRLMLLCIAVHTSRLGAQVTARIQEDVHWNWKFLSRRMQKAVFANLHATWDKKALWWRSPRCSYIFVGESKVLAIVNGPNTGVKSLRDSLRPLIPS